MNQSQNLPEQQVSEQEMVQQPTVDDLLAEVTQLIEAGSSNKILLYEAAAEESGEPTRPFGRINLPDLIQKLGMPEGQLPGYVDIRLGADQPDYSLVTNRESPHGLVRLDLDFYMNEVPKKGKYEALNAYDARLAGAENPMNNPRNIKKVELSVAPIYPKKEEPTL